MRNVMIRRTLLMLLCSIALGMALVYYIRSAGSVELGEPNTARYTASATGYASDVTVTATFADHRLVDLSVNAAGETPAVGGKIAAQLQENILADGNADEMDAVAGATLTSEAVLTAFADCVAQQNNEQT